MNNIDYIKSEIKRLYSTNPNIHINIKMTRPKLILNDVPAVIKGVYPNIFCVTETNSEYPKTHSFQYADVLIGKVEIAELSLINLNKNG